MRSPARPLARILALVTALTLLLSAVPGPSFAQDEQPLPPTVTTTPTGETIVSTSGGGDAPQIGEVYTPPAEPATPEAGDASAAPQASDEQSAPEASEEPAAPAGYEPPAELSGLSNGELAELGFPQQVQGPIRLDVVVSPERLAAGADLSYTYIFTNTGSTPTSSFFVRARFTNFNRTDSGDIVQFCRNACDPEQSTRATVAPPTFSNNEVVYQVTASLGQGESGSFRVLLGTRRDRYPQTGRPPIRPAGSAILSNTANSPTISEDTANALLVGPVFVLTKARTSQPPIYYVGDTVEFTITLGNATAPGDSSAGVVRADATAASNITLVDRLPLGSELVDAEGNPTFDSATNELRWSIPGPLNPGRSQSFRVRFRKLDVPQECNRLNNSTYSVTSEQMPIQSGTTRFRINGSSVSADIRNPLSVASITADPREPLFGEESVITIRLQSFWREALTGNRAVELRYSIQSNAFYVPGGIPALPPSSGITLISAPSGTTPGGDIVWRIDMPQGNITAAVFREVQLRVRGDFNAQVAPGNGVTTIVAPAGVPSACIPAVNGRVNFQPRLYATKHIPDSLQPDPATGRYLVQRGQSVPFEIRIQNRGDQEIGGVRVIDELPRGNSANFSYDASFQATFNGQPVAPTDVQDGDGGTITWENLTVAANSTAVLSFRLFADGQEYVNHCNNFQFQIGEGTEPTRELGPNNQCVRIAPPLRLTKTASRTTIDGNNAQDNGEVTFTLSYTNLDSRPYTVGLFDIMGRFSFVRMVEGDQPTPVQGGLRWPSTVVQPGATIRVVFVARLTNVQCSNARYPNEAGFFFTPSQGGEPFPVVTVPPTRVDITYNCGQKLISYTKNVDTAIVSTGDRHLYTLTVRNESTVASDTMNNVQLIDVLPTGFTYAGMGPNSAIKEQPQVSTRQDGRVQLVWTRSSLAPNSNTNVQFFARSGEVVGAFRNLFRATADGIAGVRNCPAGATVCNGYEVINEEGESRIYAFANVQVQTLATVEPSIDRPAECARSDETRFYQIALVNTNNQNYTSTVVTATIPLGLHFDGLVGTTPAPRSITVSERGTVLRWENLFIPARPNNASSSQLTLQVRLKVGQVWGPLQPRVEANSPDGSLPRKDGVLDPIIRLCAPSGPALGKDTSNQRLIPNAEYFYVFSLVNPGTTPLTGVGLDDTLDARIRYLSAAVGPAPTVAGQQLSWRNLTVPAATQNGPGVLTLVIKVQLNPSAAVGNIIPNRVTPAPGSPTLSTDLADVEVQVISPRTNTYLPLIRRR